MARVFYDFIKIKETIIMKRFFVCAVIFVLLGIVTGCVSLPDYRPDLPEDIGNDWLVVGQVVGIGRLWGWSHDYKEVFISKNSGRTWQKK